MSKVTLDMSTFKALASDTRLDILKSLDGKKMSLKDMSVATKLNKATLHEHLAKLHEAGLVKRKERNGHKWVYYKLSWKGECLLHPENTRIVVLFATTFITLCVGIIQLMMYVKGRVTDISYNVYNFGEKVVLTDPGTTPDKLKEGIVRVGVDNCDEDFAGSVLTNVTEIGKGYIESDGLSNVKDISFSWDSMSYGVNNTVTNFLHKIGGNPSIPKLDSSSIPFAGEGANYSAVGSAGGDTAPVIAPTLGENTHFFIDKSEGVIQAIYQDPMLLYIAIACFTVCTVVLCIALWRLWENRTPKI